MTSIGVHTTRWCVSVMRHSSILIEQKHTSLQVKHLDDHVGSLVKLLTQKGMYDNTLIAMSSDSEFFCMGAECSPAHMRVYRIDGGPVYLQGTSGANNWPLRGGKPRDLSFTDYFCLSYLHANCR